MPNRPHVPTDANRKMVRTMGAFGIPQENIAACIGIDRGTLALHYRRELDCGTAEMVTMVGQKLYDKAVKGNDTSAMIFILKTRGRWSERLIVQDADDNVDPTTLSDAELAERIARLKRTAIARRDDVAEGGAVEPGSMVH